MSFFHWLSYKQTSFCNQWSPSVVILPKHPPYDSAAIGKRAIWSWSWPICSCNWNFLFFSNWERKRYRDREPLWNNACKHMQCITQVMRFSTLLKSKAPQHLRRTNKPPSQRCLTHNIHTDSHFHTQHICLFLSSRTFFLSPSPLYEQSVCMQICRLEDPSASDVHMKLHEALVVVVDPSRWRTWFKEKGSRNGNSVCFQPFVEQSAI